MEKKSIPKIIHYCWFGNGDKPAYLIKYINGWKKILPEYEIIEWNEDMFDISYNKYTKDAYNEGKFAFVSDVARLYALYNYGGVYLDTDVEIIKPFGDIFLNKSAVFGYEIENRIATSFMAAEKECEIIKEFLDIYNKKSFYKDDTTLDLTPNVVYLTQILADKGLIQNGETQKLGDNIIVYSYDYFSPYDYIDCIDNANKNTFCIHHFEVSWIGKRARFNHYIKAMLAKIIGKKGIIRLRQIKNNIKY